MSHIKIIDSKQEWDSLISTFEHSDFYHTFYYHSIAKEKSDQPILIQYTEDDKTIALPLLIREIVGSQYKDATSVYGYPGPLTKNITADFDNANFKHELQKLFLENKIISVFSRLNPFIPFQDTVLKKLGKLSFKGRVVNVDLTLDLDKQKKSYNRRLKTYINSSRNSCYIKKATTNKEILEFIDIYYENMYRVNATDYYFFSKDYFFDLMNSKYFKTEILLSVHNDSQEIIAGAMFVKKNNIVQYHLSGVREEFLQYNCIKLLIDEMRILSTNENFQYFNLGGGLGSIEDSLFHFKSSFSKDYKDFKLWKYIVDERIYENLVSEKHQKDYTHVHEMYIEYFPSYRSVI